MPIHRTLPDLAIVYGGTWARMSNGDEITVVPLVDRAHNTPEGWPLFARLTYGDALEVAKRHDARLPNAGEIEWLHQHALELTPYLGTPTAETALVHSVAHDRDMWRQLQERKWDGNSPVSNCGKHWTGPPVVGWSRLMGWWSVARGTWWQSDSVAHKGRLHHDDGTTTMLVREADRPTPVTRPDREEPPQMTNPGDRGNKVKAFQTFLNRMGFAPGPIDGMHGPMTERATEAWLWSMGQTRKSTLEVVTVMPAPPVPKAIDPRAPACVAALRDANARWPNRKKQSDGIMGDARHQASKSDHNVGNAVDITHDPANGCDAGFIASLAIHDPRVTYVIFNRRIYNRARAAEGWRPYSGTNAHTHHVHISVRADARGDASPWGWAPGV